MARATTLTTEEKSKKDQGSRNIEDRKSRIHIINNYDCVDKYLYAIFKNGCV